MRSREIASRYAGALYEVAVEQESVPEIGEELRTLVEEIGEVEDLGRFLTHPLISRAKKLELVHAAFPDLSPSVANAVELLVRNRREEYLDLIYDEFLEARSAGENLARVRVVTATPLAGDDRRRLEARLGASFGRPVAIEERLEEELVAGARIEVEGRTIDASLRGKLSELRDLLER